MLSNIFRGDVAGLEIVSLSPAKAKIIFCEEESKKPFLTHCKNVSLPFKKEKGREEKPASGKLIVYYK